MAYRRRRSRRSFRGRIRRPIRRRRRGSSSRRRVRPLKVGFRL